MYHSITIGNKNTWDDWHLVSTSRPLVNPPTVKSHYVDIPGGNGSLDLTESISGRPVYGNRSGSWDFFVVNSGQLVPNSSYGEWYTRYTEIMEYLHGKEFHAVLEDDQAYYYQGRFTVEKWNSAKGNSVLSIKYDVNPFKRNVHGTNEPWLWNPFNFETGVIRSYKDLIVRGTLGIDYIASFNTSVPIIFCYLTSGSSMNVSFDGITYTLKNGENRMAGMHFSEGVNRLTFTGYGQITIEATGGIL